MSSCTSLLDIIDVKRTLKTAKMIKNLSFLSGILIVERRDSIDQENAYSEQY